MKPKLNLNILIAYPYFKQSHLDLFKNTDIEYNLIIDSGAYSVWNSGKKITLDEYCSFLDRISKEIKITKAVQLDVFGDPEKTLKNYDIMLERGYDVMPVFTRGDTLETLEYFYSKTDYIMFGGIVIGGKNTNYIKWFVENNKGRKAHWLGFTNLKFIKYFKPYSVDSSTMLVAGPAYGRLELFNFEGGTYNIDFRKKKKLNSKDFFLLDRNGIPRSKINKYLDKMRINFSKDEYFYNINIKTHILRDIYVENKFNTKIYKALSGERLNKVINCYKEIIKEYKLETSIRSIL